LSIGYQIAPGQEQFESQLKTIAQTFPQSGETIYKARNEIKRMHWQGMPVIVKSFAVPGTLRGLVYGQLRKSKARRSSENALELQRRSVNTPTPIGFIEHREAGALKQSFYVCHEWPASVTLREPLFDSEFPHRTEILQALGQFAFTLHERGIHHRDFSAGNILIRENPHETSTGDHWEFCLVDVNRMRFELLSLQERMGNFAMLWASDEDLEIIVRAYTQASGDHPQDALALALEYSSLHKHRANRKERIKTLLGLH
jgi:tRNA A-37 threonylcarbamoyl transferase component Bud32